MVLLLPAFGFVAMMNRSGISQFILVCEVGMLLACWLVWPKIAGGGRATAFLLSLVASYVPAVLGWGFSLRRLLFSSAVFSQKFWKGVETMLVVGGLLTIGYWLILGIVNSIFLRRSRSVA
jgi:hypothetical protein